MLAVPAAWYASVPGIVGTGPFNAHFVRDVGAGYLIAGAALAWFAANRGALPAAQAGAAFLAVHALVHLWDAAAGREHVHQLLVDLPTVFLPPILAIWIVWPGIGRGARSTKELSLIHIYIIFRRAHLAERLVGKFAVGQPPAALQPHISEFEDFVIQPHDSSPARSVSESRSLVAQYHPRVHRHAVVQIDDVVVDQADTAGIHRISDGLWRIGAVDARAAIVKADDARAERIAGTAGQSAR